MLELHPLFFFCLPFITVFLFYSAIYLLFQWDQESRRNERQLEAEKRNKIYDEVDEEFHRVTLRMLKEGEERKRKRRKLFEESQLQNTKDL